ncbi:hypothetical protein SAMN04488126_10189 [Bhargavaea beijingensis]|uniref:Restriction endonuclease n=1 Tax=Bhargavaea beijingensis TaxID=426756 RepID=A0A1G6XKI0_9BACL|nr:hypothetical protein [Bhargavaea beijingensis]SDD78582.1 hypothetical protein SAMN04488126_10189 [Bhargavaea beijingensis]
MSELHGIKVAIDIFDIKCRDLINNRYPYIYRSGSQELFSEWFEKGIPFDIQHFGANDHPDAVIEGVGFELKSLKSNGSIQFNSTIPCGRFRRKDQEGECYYAIARYKMDRDFGNLQEFCLCYGDYFNFDHTFAHSHQNTQEIGFGDYGDGVVRHRKMYSFPSPIRTVPGISLILNIDNAQELNPNLVLENSIIRTERGTQNQHVFYVYRHKLLYK